MPNEKKIDTSELTIGMYVSQLDRPWLETSFLLQGLHISSDKDIELMQEECDYVYIDLEKDQQAKYAVERRNSEERRQGKDRRGANELDIIKSKTAYTNKTEVEEEIEVAKDIRKVISVSMQECMDSVRSGKKIDMHRIEGAVKQMKECMMRNPNAFILLRALKDKDSYTYSHCMDSSALCIAFGRHLGITNENLDDLAIGAMMCDIGKARIPEEILNKPESLTEAENLLVRQHVGHSVATLEEAGNSKRAVIEIVANHHERFDGSGYFRGLKKGDIPVLSQIAAIVDSYDAMTSERCYRPAISSYEAIRRLYGSSNELFQRELVEAFIQAIGVYTVGSFVELNNGQVAIVIEQNQFRRLRPKLMVLLDENKKSLAALPIIDLIKEPTDNRGNVLEIVKGIEPADYDINPRDFYI